VQQVTQANFAWLGASIALGTGQGLQVWQALRTPGHRGHASVVLRVRIRDQLVNAF